MIIIRMIRLIYMYIMYIYNKCMYIYLITNIYIYIYIYDNNNNNVPQASKGNDGTPRARNGRRRPGVKI